jgi:adenylate kinase family enzyme
VPKEVTIGLLKNAMAAAPQSTTFLIDGFPRAMDQAVAFEDSVQRCDFVLFLECPEETMEARLLKRGETSGRADDNAESIKKRFRTYVEQTMPVIEYFGRDNRVRTVSSVPPAQEVYQQVSTLF